MKTPTTGNGFINHAQQSGAKVQNWDTSGRYANVTVKNQSVIIPKSDRPLSLGMTGVFVRLFQAMGLMVALIVGYAILIRL